MNRRIDPLAFAQVGVLAALHPQCFPEDPWDIATLAEVLRLPGFFGRVARRDENPVGFALALDLGRECEILSLGVLPAARRVRTATALLDSVCLEAQRRGNRRVVLEVAVDNHAALALYAARGFSPVGRRPAYYRRSEHPVDALVLALGLTTLPPST